jgi:hypothetical protein
MEVEELRKKLNTYITTTKKSGKFPNKFEFAKVSGFHSFKALQRFLATKGDEGRDFQEELDNEIYICLLDSLPKSKNQSEFMVRKHMLSIAGLQEKTSLELGLNPIENGSANINFALLMRVENISKKDNELIEVKNEGNNE